MGELLTLQNMVILVPKEVEGLLVKEVIKHYNLTANLGFGKNYMNDLMNHVELYKGDALPDLVPLV